MYFPACIDPVNEECISRRTDPTKLSVGETAALLKVSRLVFRSRCGECLKLSLLG